MSLKTSFYNKSVLKSDLKRFWWVGLLETIILFLVNTLPLWYRISDLGMYLPGSGYDVGRVITWQNLQFVIPCAFAISVVALLFSYMHQVASVSFYHSMPVTRKSLFVTKTMSALLLTIVPILINTLIILGIVATSDANLQDKFIAPMVWLYTGTIYTVLMISLATFVNMMVGNPIGTVLFSMGVIFLPLVGIAFYEFFCSTEVYGFYWDAAYDCMEWIYITEANLLNFTHLAVYLIMIVVFFAAAFLLYKKRKLEMYGEVIAFGWLKPVFIGIISVISSMAGYAYFGEVFRGNNIFYLIPLGLLGTIIAWMVSRKSISPKGILKPIALYMVIALCLIGVVKFDLSGFERRIPDSDDVLWANIIDVYNNHHRDFVWINGEKIEYTKKGEIDTKFYDEDDIENVIAMHRYAVENRFENDHYAAIPIMYKLKNGRTLVRQYRYNYERDIDVLKPVYNSREVRAKRFELIDGAEKEFINARISDRRLKESINYYANDDMLLKLVEAVKKDLLEISYEDSMLSSGGSVHIGFDYNYIIEEDLDISDEELYNYTQRGETVVVNDNYKNTMALLEEIGFFDNLPTVDDIVSCNVSVWKNGIPAGEIAEIDIKMEYVTDGNESKYEVTDRAQIEKLYDLYHEIITDKKFTDYNNCINVRVIYKLADREFEASCSYDEEKLPEFFKKFM